MFDLDITEQVDGSAPWVNMVVIASQSGGDHIRLCIDKGGVNEAIVHGRLDSQPLSRQRIV